MSNIVLSCTNIKKIFNDTAVPVEVLTDINLEIQAGEKVAIVGASGEGKSTLLHILGGLDTPDQGKVYVQGESIHDLSEKERCALRNHKLGFVYQFHHLLPEFTVIENVCMPLFIRDVAKSEAIKEAQAILEKMGLKHRLQHKINQLSGGERQRTAIARALITRPLCILADEPTGNLDHATAENVAHTMLELNQTFATSFLIVTHDMRLAKQMDCIYKLEAGVIKLISEA